MRWIVVAAMAVGLSACARRPARLAGSALDSATAARLCMKADSASRATTGCVVRDQRGTIVVH